MESYVSIPDAKSEHLYMTNILDKYSYGIITELYATNINGENRVVYRVIAKDEIYLLRCSSCSSKNTNLIQKFKDEYKTSLECANVCPSFARPIEYEMVTVPESERRLI